MLPELQLYTNNNYHLEAMPKLEEIQKQKPNNYSAKVYKNNIQTHIISQETA